VLKHSISRTTGASFSKDYEMIRISVPGLGGQAVWLFTHNAHYKAGFGCVVAFAGAVFIMCIMLNSFGLAWASIAAKIWLMPAGMARFWLRGIIFPGFRES
jgi:hypothetical protein